ncbi:hypothetical protein PybrP1_010439 [[Pythium] brassicae (nom. inval.)]|nr:hypothetical protein PybrP1_010439 [[Pythium] brassicae (nom. inval.)]
MVTLSVSAAREATANAFDELRVAVGAPPEQIVAAFRALCLQRALSTGSPADDLPDAHNDHAHDADARFQRQAVAYRFLSSLPLLDDTEYRAEHVLGTLRPLPPVASSHEGATRASAMLDVAITSMEQAQRAWGLPYTNYVISVHYWLHTHVVRRRYSEFVALHRALAAKLPVVPALPPRSWAYKLRLPPPGCVRAQELTQYLMRVVALLAARGLFSLDVMNFLEVDHRRVRAHEEALAVSFLARSSGGSNGVYYIVCSDWLRAWKKFVEGGAGDGSSETSASADPALAAPPPPGRISNDQLLDPVTRAPKDNLSPARHYRCVNAATWRYLARVYGVSGSTLPRKQPSIYATAAVDLAALAALVQPVVRGFLGRCAARRRRAHVALQDPSAQARASVALGRSALAARMAAVRRYVDVREFQTRHVAATKIQRAFRVFLLRAEHKLLLAESAVPPADDGFQRLEEYLSLEEIGLLGGGDPRLKLAHFLVTLSKGVPVQKLRSRRKSPKWRLFQINAIGSELRWSSKARAHALAFADVASVAIEAPVMLKTAFGRRRSSAALAQGVVVKYRDRSSGRAGRDADDASDDSRSRPSASNKSASELLELILVCESACDCEALHFGLSALVAETQGRTAHGASYVDGHGAIRKKVAHAKRLLHEAQELLGQRAADSHRLALRVSAGAPVVVK